MSLYRTLKSPVSQESVKIGGARSDARTLERVQYLLTEVFPDLRPETAAEGFRYLPLYELLKVEARVKEAEEAGYQRGKTEGYNTGLKEGRSKSQEAFQTFTKAYQDLVHQREQKLVEAERDIVDIVMKLVRKLTFGSAETNPEVTAAVVKGAIESLVDKREITVHVHPDHLEQVRAVIQKFHEWSGDLKTIQFEADMSVGLGGCIINTPAGEIDARLDSQLKLLEESIKTSSNS